MLEQVRSELAAVREETRGTTDPVLEAQSVHLLANLERDLGADERARALWEEAVAILRPTGDSLQLAHKLRHLGDVHGALGRLDAADACYGEALDLYRSHPDPDPLDLANALQRVAGLRETQGRNGAAIALWQEAETLYRSLGLQAGVDEAAAHLAELQDGG